MDVIYYEVMNIVYRTHELIKETSKEIISMEQTLNLKPVSNVSLLSMYRDYYNNCSRYIMLRDNVSNPDDKKYWADKLKWEIEVLNAVEQEILKRMSGKEID